MSAHSHHSPPPAPELPVTDAGSRALEEALRSSFAIVRVVMFVLVVVLLLSGMKTIGPQERGIKFRFGKAVGSGPEQLLGPGLHWAWPEPIERIEKIPVTEIQNIRSTIGFSLSPADLLAGKKLAPTPSLNPAAEGYLVMADHNIMHGWAALGYRITDPIAYSFNFLNASNTVLNIINHALLYAAAQTTAYEALTNSTVFKERVLARARERIAAAGLGITIEPGSEVKILPPAYVQADFDAVTAAEQDRSKNILAEEGKASQRVLEAQGEANARLAEAEAERNRIVTTVVADAKAFTAQLPQYQANPELFRQRLLTERWQRILAKAPDKFFLPERNDGQARELRLQLSREPLPGRTAQPQP